MLMTIISAFIKAFLPLLLLSTLLSYWYLRKHMPEDETTSTRDLRKTIEQHSKKIQEDESGESMAYAFGSLPNKWLAFGGNFYGLVALYTYLLIEYRQFAEFFANFTSIADMLDKINSDMIKEQIIQAFQNLAYAIGWPAQWLKDVDGNLERLIWLGLAYAGFLLGMKSALLFKQKRT